MTVLADGRVLIVGGNNGTAPVASTDIFDPVAGTASAGPSLSVARFGHSATTLLNGQVVVIGGNNGNANPAQMDVTPAELVDFTAATPAFTTLVSNLATPREGHLAFLLPNNNSVLIVGGTSGGTTVASAELFTPKESSQGVWTYLFGSTGSMTTARGSTTGAPNQVSSTSSVMQRNGVLMVAGGKDANGNALNSAEAYGFPTVQTDQSDYPPGTTVTITGSGWQPGETVTIQLVESPLIDTHGPYTVAADTNGNISDSSFVTDTHDLDVKFNLTAVGSVSQAQTTFTDSNHILSVVVGAQSPGPISPGSSATYPISFTRNGSGADPVTLSVISGLPTGASASFSPNPVDVTLTSTLTITTTGNTPTGTFTFTVRAVADATVTNTDTLVVVTPTTTTVSSSANPSTYGSSVTFTATISPNAGSNGTVAFKDGATTISGCAAVPLASSQATCATSTLSAATHFITAVYSGSSTFGGSTSSALSQVVNKATPTLSVTNSPVTYNGSPQAATVSGSTAGTVSNIKYNGSATVPTNAATYAITADFAPTDTTNYSSLTTASAGNFVIQKATPTVTFTGGTFTYDGNSHAATATAVAVDGHTAVTGSFSFTYTPPGNSTAPTNAGTYTVGASFTSTDPNYTTASGSGSITINKVTPVFSALASQSIPYGTATISLSGKIATANDSVRAASPDTVTATINGVTSAPIGFNGASGTFGSFTFDTHLLLVSGSPYTITYTYSGGANLNSITDSSTTLTVTKATATVTLSNLTQTYTGSPLMPTATTVPASLAITWTGAPDTNAGSYPVTATVNDPNYQGTASGTFIITKATVTVTLSNLT